MKTHSDRKYQLVEVLDTAAQLRFLTDTPYNLFDEAVGGTSESNKINKNNNRTGGFMRRRKLLSNPYISPKLRNRD